MRSAVVRAERKSKIGENPLLDEHQDRAGHRRALTTHHIIAIA
jgi:hypothetical protein